MERQTKEDRPTDRKIDRDIQNTHAGGRAGRQSPGGSAIHLIMVKANPEYLPFTVCLKKILLRP